MFRNTTMARLNSSMSIKLTDDIINRLKVYRIFTAFDFVKESTEKLIATTALHFRDILEIKQQMIEKFGGKTTDPLQLLEDQSKIISTEISSLDNLLKGGLYPGQIYEICGRSSAGKSQLCLILTANIASKSNGIIHYIDTRKNFSATRIQMIFAAKQLSDEEMGIKLSQIKVTHVTAIHQLLNILYNLTHSLKENDNSYKLVIIDSLPTLFVMSQNDHDNFYTLNHLANVCRFLANEYCFPIITVNLVTKWQDCELAFSAPSGSALKPTSIVKPFLGKYWYNIPNTRLLIEHTHDENRKISVWKSGNIKINASIQITINNAGII